MPPLVLAVVLLSPLSTSLSQGPSSSEPAVTAFVGARLIPIEGERRGAPVISGVSFGARASAEDVTIMTADLALLVEHVCRELVTRIRRAVMTNTVRDADVHRRQPFDGASM